MNTENKIKFKAAGFASGRGGFTLMETLVSTSIGMMVLIATLSTFIYSARHGGALRYQIDFNGEARSLTIKYTDIIERTKGALVEDNNSVLLEYTDGGKGHIRYIDQDNDESTLEDNVIVYIEDDKEPDKTKTLCTYALPIGDIPVFRLFNGTKTMCLTVHIGDADKNSGIKDTTGPGRQGVEVHISAESRNMQRVYEKTD